MHRIAAIDRVHEIGESIHRLKKIVALAYQSGELTPAISAQTQINKLLSLYPKAGEGDEARAAGPGTDQDEELGLIAAHLRPLGLAPDDYPLHEIARIAADRVRRSEPGP